MRHRVATGTLCYRVKILAFQLTAHIHPSSRFYRDGEWIGPLKGTPNAIKSVWEGSHFAAYCPQPRLAPVPSARRPDSRRETRGQAKAETGAGACKMGPEPEEGGKIKS